MIQFQSLPALLLISLPLAGCISPSAGQTESPMRESVGTAPVDPADLGMSANLPAFDPCEEIRRQLAESRRAFSLLGSNGLSEQAARAEAALRSAELAADDARELAHNAAMDHLEAQNEMRRVETTRSDEADAFCREVLDLSGIGTTGSLSKTETEAGSHWVSFTVLEDPATDVYYLEQEEDPNSGERCRIALQETMFTEFPKYWDRTRDTRDRLNLATLELASTLRVKQEAEETARTTHERIRELREQWYASCEGAQRVHMAMNEMLELEQSLERCAGGEGLAGRIQRIELRLDAIELRAEDVTAEFGRTREEVAVIAPTGYRRGAEKHLAAAWDAMAAMNHALEVARGSSQRAMSAFARDRRDKAREHATRAQRSSDQIEEALGNVTKFFDRARFAAEEGLALYFQDGPENRARNAALSRMDLDGLLLEGLRTAITPEELNPVWAEHDLFATLPVWLSSFEQEGVLRMPAEALAPTRELLTFVQHSFRLCEPQTHAGGLVRKLLDDGHARTEQDAYLMLGEMCGLLTRLSAMTSDS